MESRKGLKMLVGKKGRTARMMETQEKDDNRKRWTNEKDGERKERNGNARGSQQRDGEKEKSTTGGGRKRGMVEYSSGEIRTKMRKELLAT